MIIRDTKDTDLEEVFKLIQSAFENKAESDLVRRLISDGDVLINLLAESSDSIIGNVVVSKTTMEPDVGLFCGGVGPLSVLPKQQSLGVGSKLMRGAVNESKKLGMESLFLLGGPGYYKRFGVTVSKLRNDFSVKHFQELQLIKGCLINVKAKIKYADAFLNLE